MPRQIKKDTKKPKETKVAKKTISKKESEVKLSKQNSKAEKKETKKNGDSKLLELGLLLDCTSSMGSWIERAKKTLIDIIKNVVDSCDGKLKVRVCFVGYRDHCDTERFSIKNFSEDIEDVKKFINSVKAIGGGDFPEDVVGGMRKCLDQSWTQGSSRQVFHIFDAPCHGRQYCDGWDSYPDGSPEGYKLEDLMKEFKDKSISFTCIKLNEQCNKMIKAMQDSYPAVQITDLASAIQTKSAEEVTNIFVESASFILRAAVGGKDKTKGAAGKRDAVKKGKPLWDPKKLEVEDIFSCISYLKVLKVEGNTITVKNQLGGQWIISKDLIERDMWSADHFDKEIKCTMTELSGLIEQCGDTIFKVQFRKKVDEKQIESQLQSIDFKDLKKADQLKAISKQLIEGEQVEIVAHLVDCDNNLGRSAIIDLNAPESNNFRQVDHRSIDYIIYKNVKYSLGKKPAGQVSEEIPIKTDYTKPKWNSTKLAVENWFSQSNYYKVQKIVDKENVTVVATNEPKKELTMSRDILEYEMNSGKIYESEEKVTRTEMVNLLINAKECVFTAKFHKKVDEKYIQEILGEVKSKDQLKDPKQLKKLAKELISGKEIEMTCFLLNSDGKLGRSSVIDLNSPPNMNFRQIDHRTLESLIVQNKKYILK